MKKSRLNWSIEKYNEEIEKGLVSFDYPIQREGEQWTQEQKSLLIHSIACDYPVPPIYALGQNAIVGEGEKAKEKLVLFLLDGKQRTTNVSDFINGKYRIHKETPPFIIDDEEHDFSDYRFEELPVSVQKAIQRFTLDIYKIEDALDSEIESMFFRLNNGTPLTQVQKAKANMGSVTADKFKHLVKHATMQQNAVFTTHQIKQADHEVALLQAMMLLDDNYTVGKFGNKEVYDYASSLRDSDDAIFKKTELTLDYLHETLGDNVEKTLLKKLHLPMVVWASHEALKSEVPPVMFADWLEGFKEKINSKENGDKLNGLPNENAWLYKLGCGAGATKAEKVSDRLVATKHEITDFIQRLDEAEAEDKESYERLKAEKAEQARLKAEQAEQAKVKAEEEKAQKEAEKERKLAEKATRDAEKAEKARIKAEEAEQDKLAKEAEKAQTEQGEQTELVVEGENVGEVK